MFNSGLVATKLPLCTKSKFVFNFGCVEGGVIIYLESP